MSSLALVESLLEANQWREMFVGMIGSSATMEVISSGSSRNNVLQLMRAEIQLVSPLVPARVVKFIRLGRQQADGVWVVVDLSVNAGTRRRPSGCILRDMPNGFTTVTWIEHTEYDENLVDHQYRRSLSSGLGFGAQKWICALLRHCESVQAITSPIANHGLLLVFRVGDEVFLKSILNPAEIVARGWVKSLDPNVLVGDKEIGHGWCEVNAQVPIKKDEMLVRSYELFSTIQDCIGATIAWPCSFISVVRED